MFTATRTLATRAAPAATPVFLDNFNRTENPISTNGWTNQLNSLQANGSLAVVNSWNVRNLASVAPTEVSGTSDVYVEVQASAVGDYPNPTLFLRGNNSHQVVMENNWPSTWVHDIDTSVGTWAAGTWTNRVRVGNPNALTAAEVTRFEAIGNTYISRSQGVPVAIWHDTNGTTWAANVDSSHREVGMALWLSGGNWNTSGFDYFKAAPIDYSFLPCKMTKSGTLSWPTSGTYFAITTWTAVQTALTSTAFTTLITSNALTVLTSGTGKTIYASVPYTGSTAGRSHLLRVVRTRLANGTADTTVIGTAGGTNPTTASGTAEITLTGVTVTQGETYQLQMAGSGATNGTVTATTPYFQIT